MGTSNDQSGTPMCGLLVIDKPLGLSSMAVVRRVRRAAGGTKTGHAGTLDPLATGILICCIGRATKQVETLMGLPKCYEATIDLSAFTATDDREGEREEIDCPTPPPREAIATVLTRFVGDIEQVPPAYSAVHVGGQRAYAMARRGEKVTLPARMVRIDAIDLLAYQWPMLRLRIRCGKGTYIRSLARAMGTGLCTGGHLAALRRTEVGRFSLEQALEIDRLERPLRQEDLLEMGGV